MKWILSIVFAAILQSGHSYLPDLVPDVVSDIIPKVPSSLNFLFVNRCIEDLGCFYTGPPFYHATVRPISLPPATPLARFLLYTPSNPDEEYNLEADVESLQSSPFNPLLPTKIIIHGFRSDLDVNDIRFEMRQALLEHGNYNVIIVDWTENNGFPYAQAAANTRSNGAKIAQLIQFLMEYAEISPESIHIIGHSLGGQMAGYVGERIPNLGRITGLDPAGPFFQGMDAEVRLDTTDALFVDVIHTDGGEFVLNGLGTSDATGHVDFYPNGGRRQPGCIYASESETIVGSAVNYTTKWLSNGCDHGRANDYFLESINNQNCRFLAVRCTNYRDFEKGLCPPENSTVAEMGFHAVPDPRGSAKFFLRTSSSSSYCVEDSIFL